MTNEESPERLADRLNQMMPDLSPPRRVCLLSMVIQGYCETCGREVDQVDGYCIGCDK